MRHATAVAKLVEFSVSFRDRIAWGGFAARNLEPENPSMKTNKLIMLAALALGVLAIGAARAQAQSSTQLVKGQWHGFYLQLDDPRLSPLPTQPQRADLVLGHTSPRQFGGAFALGPEPQLVLEPFIMPVAGKFTAANLLVFTGRSLDGAVSSKLTLHNFGGGAAILDGALKFNPSGPAVTEHGTLLLLRKFISNPNETQPDVTGHYEGTFSTQNATAAGGIIVLDLDARLNDDGKPETGFRGGVKLEEGGPALAAGPITFGTFAGTVRGTIDADGKVVAIAQGTSGRVVLLATWVGPQDPSKAAVIAGTFRLVLNNGSTTEGKFEAMMQAPAAPQ
jgi:hypothetical protein